MSTLSEKPVEREAAIRNARLRLIELEIESHRIKAELARLEAAREDAAADRLVREFPEAELSGVSPDVWKRVLPTEALDQAATDRATEEVTPGVVTSHELHRTTGDTGSTRSSRQRRARRRSKTRVLRRPNRFRIAPAWVLSLAVHGVLLLLFGVFTFATLQNEALSLMVSSADAIAEVPDAPVEVEVEQPQLEEEVLHEVVLDSSAFELDSPSLTDFADPAENFGADLGGDIGFLDSLPADVGTLMAGIGGGGTGSGGRSGRSRFFGTEAEGKRFVFVVDNSGSMQQGRMETTFLELLQCVESMGRDQYFFVIFYSDQAYPLFYPESAERLVSATQENKQRLRAWLPTVELCTGGQLIEAMELAEKLQPQVVYLLSDGQYGGARTMTYMTDENDWPFVIHTLGMNVRNEQDATNLALIAQAHGGTFRMVQPSPQAIQMALARPIKYNRSRGSVWGTKIRQR